MRARLIVWLLVTCTFAFVEMSVLDLINLTPTSGDMGQFPCGEDSRNTLVN